MILNMYALWDSKAEAFSTPFYHNNDALAERACKDMLADPMHPVARHPQDYKLFYCGTYDDTTCQIDALPPEHMLDLFTLQTAAVYPPEIVKNG